MKKTKAKTPEKRTGDVTAIASPGKPPLPSAGEFKIVPRNMVRPDPTQPRKEFEEGPLVELAWSIRERGIIQPLVVQLVAGLRIKEPDMIQKNWQAVDAKGAVVFEGGEEEVKGLAEHQMQDYYQLIFGERRYRASAPRTFKINDEEIKWGGLDELPVIVREVTEHDRFVLQFIENNHRVNLSALEEARAFDEQIKKRRQTDPGFGPDKLAEELGHVKRSTIYNRLKLLRLHEPVRQALLTGKIEAMVATEIATLPDPKKQEELLKQILNNMDYGNAMSFREVAEMIDDEYVKQLKSAPFDKDDEALLPTNWEVIRGQQTLTYAGIQPQNFEEIRHAPETGGKPWHVWEGELGEQKKHIAGPMAKKDAEALFHLFRSISQPIEFKRLSGGACVVCPHRSGVMNPETKSPNVCTLPACFDAKVKAHWLKKSEELKAKGTEVLTEGQMRKLGKHVPEDKHEYTQSRSGVWKDLMGKHAPEPVLVATKEGIKKFYPLEEAKSAAKKNGVKFYSTGTPKTAAEVQKEKDAQAKRETTHARREELVKSLWEDVAVALAGLKDAEAWTLLSEHLVRDPYADQVPKNILVKEAKGHRARVLGALLLEQHEEPVQYNGEWDEDALKLWKLLGFDLVKLEKQAEERAQPALPLKKPVPQQKELLTVGKPRKKKGGG